MSWAAPEILKGGATIARETDVFAFGMIVIEVGPHPLPHLALEVEVHLTSEFCLRFSPEGVHSSNSQPRSSPQRSSMADDQLVRGECKD